LSKKKKSEAVAVSVARRSGSKKKKSEAVAVSGRQFRGQEEKMPQLASPFRPSLVVPPPPLL